METILKTTIRTAISFAILGLTGCCVLDLAGCASVGTSYVRADRLTYEAVAPEYKNYVRADTELTAEQRESILYTIELWARRIREAESVIK